MKVVSFACAFSALVWVAASAPTVGNEQAVPEQVFESAKPQLREKRSQYGSVAYAPPCASGAPLGPVGQPHGYLSPVHSGYGYGGGIPHGYGGGIPHGYGYGPHYRNDEAEGEFLNFSDMDQGMSEHMPMARYGGYGQLAPAVSAGPAFGVFPNANAGRCAVPLLLSCSPSIVPGRLVSQGYGGGGYGGVGVVPAVGVGSVGAAGVSGIGGAYRGVDDQQMEHEDSEKQLNHEHAETTNEDTH